MFFDVCVGNAFHAIDLDVDVVSIGQCVRDLIDGLFVNLHAMDGQTGSGVQLLVANVTLEVLCLLVLDQYLLVIELAVAVPVTQTSPSDQSPHDTSPKRVHTYQHHGVDGFAELAPMNCLID